MWQCDTLNISNWVTLSYDYVSVRNQYEFNMFGISKAWVEQDAIYEQGIA